MTQQGFSWPSNSNIHGTPCRDYEINWLTRRGKMTLIKDKFRSKYHFYFCFIIYYVGLYMLSINNCQLLPERRKTLHFAFFGRAQRII